MLNKHNIGILHLLIAIAIIWTGLFYNSIASTVAIWERSETFTHCFIIFPICLYLIYQNWPALSKAKIQPNYWVLVAILFTMVIWLLGNLAQMLVIEQGATFLLLPLFIWLVLGNQVAKIMLFPLVFWMFSVPAGEFLIPSLQDLTADITVYTLRLTGVPVYREGLYIAIPGGLFEVAVACSGIRYLIASFTLGTLFAYLSYTSRKKQIIFVLFSLFLPLLANGIRAYGIVMIAYLTEMKYATGVDHLIYGWLWFGVVILIMFAVGNIWRDPLPASTEDKIAEQRYSIGFVVPSFLVILASCLLMFGYKSSVSNMPEISEFDAQQVLPAGEPLVAKSWLPRFQNPTIEKSGNIDGVDFYIAYYGFNQQNHELINSINQVYNEKAWSRVSRQSAEQFNTVEIINSQGIKRLLAYTYVNDWFVTPSTLKIKLSQAVQALLGQPQTGYFIALSIPLEHSGAGRNQLNDFTRQYLNDGLKEALHASN
ncbi:exosortase A [Neptunicella sp. SCSIO 80796]|uniref:exosortase A n=1 Tax=Neptunicella plasticusilytica TaxID=3117012 RepID=UPI003A4D8315